MTKSSYREYFANVKKYVKMKPFLEASNISLANFSYFMKGSAYDHLLSLDKLKSLELCIIEMLSEVV